MNGEAMETRVALDIPDMWYTCVITGITKAESFMLANLFRNYGLNVERNGRKLTLSHAEPSTPIVDSDNIHLTLCLLCIKGAEIVFT